MFHPAGQTQVVPRQHPCMHLLSVGLWEKCWWIASTIISCMSGKEIIADGKKFLWKVPFKHTQWPWSWGHAGGTSGLTHTLTPSQRAAWARFLWSHLPANTFLLPCNVLFCTPRPQYWGHFSLATWPHWTEHPPLGKGMHFTGGSLTLKKSESLPSDAANQDGELMFVEVTRQGKTLTNYEGRCQFQVTCFP